MTNKPPLHDTSGSDRAANLEVRELTVAYGSVEALANVSLAVRKAEIFTLVGASGSGKTTLLLSVAGFVPIKHGRLFLAGADITSLPPNAREIGMVFQSYTLFPHMTVFDNVAYSLAIRNVTSHEVKRHVAQLLKLLKMENFGSRYPHQLSGGQQQRVALARALAFSPRLLLLDEPLAAVDRKLRLELQSEIRRVQRATEATVVYVTHDQKEAMAISDRMGILRDGRLLQIGTPREIYDAPANPYVADFLGGANLLPVRIVTQNPRSCDVELAGYRISGIPRPPWLTATVGNGVLMIRPEHWKVRRAVSGHFDTLPGKIEEITFEGNTILFGVRLRSEVDIKVRRSTDEVNDLVLGDSVDATVNGQQTQLFEQSKGSVS